MYGLQELIEPAARIAVQALINSLWQGAVIAGLAWVLMRAVDRANAPTRYAVWWAVLLAIVVTTALSARVASRDDRDIFQSATPSLSHAAIDIDAPQPLLSKSRPPGEQAAPDIEKTPKEPLIFSVGFLQGWSLMAVFFAWLAGATWRLIQLANSYAHLRRLKRSSLPVNAASRVRFKKWVKHYGEGRPVKLRVSDMASTPIAAGFINPAIILPANLAECLTEAEFDQVVLHELAHIRRRDDWAKLAQRLIESVLFFHPAVLWAGERLNLEREIACDDRVVWVTGESKPYAACLIKLVEITRLRQSSMLAPGVLMRKRQISRRIEMLLDKKRNATLRISVAGLGMMISALSLAVVVGASVSPVIALPDDPAIATKTPDSRPAQDASNTSASASPVRNVTAPKTVSNLPGDPLSRQATSAPAPSGRQLPAVPAAPTPPALPDTLPTVPRAAPLPPALPAGQSEAERLRYQKQLEQYEQAMKLYEEQMRQYDRAMRLYNEQMDAYNEQMREYERLIQQYEKEMREFDRQVFNLVPGVVLQLFKQEINNLEADIEKRSRLYRAAEHASPVIARELVASLRDLKINRPEGFIMIVSHLSANSIGSKLRRILDEARDSRAVELDGDSLAKLDRAIERISPALQRLVVHRFN